ncbi:Protein of unknown function [Bacillus mycoides]|nr:Protein of unknown function [Bacillus mycoides]
MIYPALTARKRPIGEG